MIAGPSEVLIITDGSLPPGWVAADLLAQEEHDEMAVPILVTDSTRFAKAVIKEVGVQLKKLKRYKIAKDALTKQGRIFIVKNIDDAVRVANIIAPEHLELCVKDPKKVMNKVRNAGAIFLGSLSTEAFGDYVAGPSHVLPTGGAARFSSPLSVLDFLKMPSVLSISKKGLDELSESVVCLANIESLEAHTMSVQVRCDG
jgi:histidinol dehydrogenase